MLTRTFLLTALLAALSCAGCGGGTTSPVDAAVRMDAATFDAGEGDASAVDAATIADAGSDAGTAVDASEPPVTCSSLPACEADKGCGPILSAACCCGDTVFDPETATGCCCGYGIVPGAFLTCDG